MSPRHGARLAALLVPAVLAVVPATAHAEQVTIDDPAGDARAINLASELGGFFLGTGDDDLPPFLDAPAEAATDVVRTTVQHGRRVSVTLQFRDLVEPAEHFVEVRVTTPEDRFDLSVAHTGGDTQANLFPPAFAVLPGGGIQPRPCRTVRARYDAVAETVTASFPSACIGKPRWIQVSAGASRVQVTPVGDGSVNVAGWVDDAFRSGVSQASRGKSPRIHRR